LIIDDVENKLYFSSSRAVTLSLLSAFDNIKHWVPFDDNGVQKTKEEVIPIKFGSGEKALRLEDIDTKLLVNGNFTFLPRMVLSFEGIQRDPERMLNKFNKVSKKWYDNGVPRLDYSYQSIPVDLAFNLNIQARGLTQAFQIIEQIMVYFRPTMPLEIQEFPLFQERTVTQILIEDPDIDVLEEMDEVSINLINIVFPLVVRTNFYSPITLSSSIKTLKLNEYIMQYQKEQSHLAWKYQLDKNQDETEWIETIDEHLAPPV